MSRQRRLNAATRDLDPPFAVVDLAALRANAADLTRRAAGRPIRVASKSVRCRAVLRDVLATDGFAGVLAYTLAEARWLATDIDDVVVAYPTADRGELRALVTDPAAARRVTLMVDGIRQLDFIDSAIDSVIDSAERPRIRLCIDVDASLRLLGGRLHIGARRSPLHSADAVAAVARQIVDRPGFRLVGLMSYEAQIAGVGDRPPGHPLKGAAVRAMQAASVKEIAARRAAVVSAVKQVAPLEFVNGGGTGSVDRTARERAVTEIAAGSGLYAPRLFDSYRAFTPQPAALFALPVTRTPAPGIVTVAGGGWIGSGPAGADRWPVPVYPTGLSLLPTEGAGEVQTPVRGAATADLDIGDRVWFRHAKAGELCEHVDALHLIEDDAITASVPTYRGEGKTFL
ncbi:MAG TPA: amino acid deaminase/aldolase [Mycobacteriales bacterium]|nr:amino acid deaminase/aldolase [Mycobacteriales bacterium]